MDNTEIEQEVISLVTEQKDLERKESELMEYPRFGEFIKAQKTFKERSELMWAVIEEQMVTHSIKSIKGDWGSITVAERNGFDIDMVELPSKFLKKVADLKKIGDTYKLEGKAPKGTTPKITKYLMRRIK
jgi:hypothetical protein